MTELQRFYQWVISSPPLLEIKPPISDLTVFSNHQKLDDTHTYDGNPRLGFLYQHLCEQVIMTSDNYSIKHDEIQINVEGRTLGAIDFILEDTSSQKLEHWEVAIKFYLLHEQTWFGPNSHDQLDKKLDRMLCHQLGMSSSNAFVEQYPEIDVDSKHLLMQGRLYTNPFLEQNIPTECLGYSINPSQVNGFWCYQNQTHQITDTLYPLTKEQWAAGTDDFSGEPITEFGDHFVHGQTKSGQFWFVMPQTWPHG
ncbi:DUF1853 family protein [Vibrio sp. 10N.261.52.A1]|uniref:DUF1853 family protein n=1 Tax=Vibrio TaxID=662 RepID=UPI000C823BAE|nr:DUF1853 family protein [Vibrio sp. 10N.261.52.A1]PML53400.1 type II citrate synthase [Vibrio sp. 10N.261.52.A1]